MCGRTACSLSRGDISYAAGYRSGQNRQYVGCEWFVPKPNQSYEPNFNQTSGHYLPILVQKNAIDKTSVDSKQKVLTSMRWGLTPHWIKSSDDSNKLNPLNCRFETIAEKRTFSHPLKNGRRCVVLVDGFFEWKTNKDNSKDPYFLYFPQKYVDFKNRDKDWIKKASFLTEDNEWKGPRLLTMAALFNRSDDNSLTFTIITVPVHSSLQWLHSRMPAILDSDKSIDNWLDFNNVSTEEALKLLVPFGGLEFHSVSRLVSNTRNNSFENLLPIKLNVKQKTIDNWFKPKTDKHLKSEKQAKEEDKEVDGSDPKKLKTQMD